MLPALLTAPAVLGAFSLLSIVLFYRASSQTPLNLSPQGCRMSWMSPSYLLQPDFNRSWTPLADRYSLWLYREVGWEHELHGQPVLFIPGNAGSSHQVRSIASSATRQFFSSPHELSPEFAFSRVKPLDFFAVEFNEDFSALHGPTLDSQRSYTSAAINYILSLYPANTSITIMGHSMGGVVATSLLPSTQIAAIITMSAPHTLPPARFDRRIDAIYAHIHDAIVHDPTPILSLCGGATDMMIPSESCVLPDPTPQSDGALPFRRTVFASALEGSWTGVGHQEMVWCHQVRWRIARAALELSAASALADREAALDKWLTDGSHIRRVDALASTRVLSISSTQPDQFPENARLALHQPRQSKVYLFPVPRTPAAFVLYVSQGSIPPVAPQNAVPLSASIYLCRSLASPVCTPLEPTSLRLIPNPVPGKPFPLPEEGTDESEGVVAFRSDSLSKSESSGDMHIAVSVEQADGRGWLAGGFVPSSVVNIDSGIYRAMLGSINVPLDPSSLLTEILLPNLWSHVLLVYRVTPLYIPQSCEGTLLAPLLTQTSQYEAHYHSLSPSSRPILLHSHALGPYISRPLGGVKLAVQAAVEPGCGVQGLVITLDWWSTLGRWGPRYWPALASWAVGIAAVLFFNALEVSERAPTPSVPSSLGHFIRKGLPAVLLGSFALALLPSPAILILGTSGTPLFAPIAPILCLLSTGLVVLSWHFLAILVWLINLASGFFSSRIRRVRTGSPTPASAVPPRTRRSALFSLALVCGLIALFVPWQIVFLGCWIFHLSTCAAAARAAPASGVSGVPLVQISPPSPDEPSDAPSPTEDDQKPAAPRTRRAASLDVAHENAHLLLLLTWLLPLAAPVLAVWGRTLYTAGWTAPFDGDHNFLYVAPFVVLVDFASWSDERVLLRHRREPLSLRWALALLGAVSFLIGARQTYKLFEFASLAAFLFAGVRVGFRYWVYN